MDPSAWVDAHGQVLYRYALARVRKPDIAEELVQEAFLSALKSKDQFQGRSTERTWLTGILRHKILDYFRAQSRTLPEVEFESHEDMMADMFDRQGNWRTPPDALSFQPESLLEREDFWRVFDACLDGLPDRARQAFVLRVLEEESVAAACKILGVSTTNLYVIIFRARTQMRRCLTLRWLQATGAKPPDTEAE